MLKITETNRKWWILAAGITSLSMIFVDQTALPIAFRSIQEELHVGSVMMQWIINAYLLMLATFVIFGGKLSDKLGHKFVFILGQILFVLSSIACALGHSGLWIAINRGFQGIGGALMIPATQTIIFNSFEAKERGRAMGLYVGLSSVFLILGPLIGGFLTDFLSWRWIFWVNLPIAAVGIWLCILAVPEDQKSVRGSKKIDFLGFILMSLGLFLLVFGLMEGPSHGWTSPFILTCFVVSLISLLSFVRVQKRKSNPFIDLRVFKDRNFTYCSILMLCMQSAFMVVIFWIIFLEYAIPVSTSTAGVIVIAAQGPMTFMAPLAGRVVDRYGPRFASTLGISLIIVSFAWIALFAWTRNYWWLIPGFFLYGTMVTLPMFGIMSLALRNIPLEIRGVASGILNTARLLGNSIGLALLSSIIIEVGYLYFGNVLSKMGENVNHYPRKALENMLASPHIISTKSLQIYHLAVKSYVFGFSSIMVVVMIISFIGLVLARKLPDKSQI